MKMGLTRPKPTKLRREPAEVSEIITIEIAPEQGTPTEMAATPTPTTTPSPSSTPTEAPTLTPTAIATPVVPPEPDTVRFGDWLMALLLTGGVGGINYSLAKRKHNLRWSVRATFLTLIGGLLAYSYLAIKLPGSQGLITSGGSWSVFWITLLGALVGAASLWLWQLYATHRGKQS